MAKKQEESTAPKVTSLPLPISDTPLVIDLPDGQKIVIGKLQPGSVIEVATWRGTGRPDSRTNRLMMGMNNGETSAAQPSSEQTASTSQSTQASDWKTKATIAAKNLVNQTQAFVSQVSSKMKKEKSVTAQIQPANQESASALASASEVDEWLKKVLEQSEKKTAKALEKKATTPNKALAPKKATKTVKKAAPKKSKR
jgi:hypothetical protein